MKLKWIDFVVEVLTTQANTLQRLAAFFGEDILLQMLESVGDTMPNPDFDPELHTNQSCNVTTDPSLIYLKLEGAVHDLKLPAVLEFHLWAYPFYRSIIESSIDLTRPLVDVSSQEDLGITLVNQAISYAEQWIKQLPIPPEISMQAERAALVPWLRFRSDVLRKLGKNPFVSL